MTTAATTPVLIEDDTICCIACSGETDKFVKEYEGHCERCYTKKFHPQVWAQIRQEEEWCERRQADTESEDEDDAEEHKCGICKEMFKVNDEGWYNGEYFGRPVCYDCYDEDECY